MIHLIKERLKRKPLIAALYRIIYPSYGTCGCCGLPWSVAHPHIINYRSKPSWGFFAVCDYCFEHKPLGEIDDATLELHYGRLRRGHDDEDINEMIEETHKDYERIHNNQSK